MKFSIEFVFVYVGSKLPHVFIFNEVTWFFPSNVYLRESTNRAISYTPWWDGLGWMSFAHIVFHDAALYSFVFPFHCLLDIRKNKHVYLYDIVLHWVFFLFLFLGFFAAWVNIFCSSDIVRIHHVFSLVVYIIFPFSSDPSLIYRFVYEYV